MRATGVSTGEFTGVEVATLTTPAVQTGYSLIWHLGFVLFGLFGWSLGRA